MFYRKNRSKQSFIVWFASTIFFFFCLSPSLWNMPNGVWHCCSCAHFECHLINGTRMLHQTWAVKGNDNVRCTIVERLSLHSPNRHTHTHTHTETIHMQYENVIINLFAYYANWNVFIIKAIRFRSNHEFTVSTTTTICALCSRSVRSMLGAVYICRKENDIFVLCALK